MFHASSLHSLNRAAEYLSGWQRARAELANYRRRVSQEQQQQQQQTKQQLIHDLIPLVDNFRAITLHLPAALKDDIWAQGVIHVARQLEQLLSQQYQVESIDAIGQPFNPHLHEAIAMVKNTPYGSGCVTEVLQAGYKIGDHVIRPAKVKVAK